MNNIVDGLNKAQYEAVTQTEGPLMVMAGAGSGKTRVLTHRIAYIINECGVEPQQILAVTFTNKAAREMKERLSKLVDDNIDEMWVSTFHSMCCRILRVEISKLDGYTSRFVILDDEDAVKYVKEAIEALNLDKEEYKPKLLRGIISSFKNDVYTDFRDDNYKRIMDKYNALLKEDNSLDFDDLILKTLELFKTNPKVLEKYQNKFSYILVDEFQDTNKSQYEIVKLLSLRHRNIFIVGDQDQSIYSFRGAKVENINKFERDFLGTKVILLEQNYRSTQSILNTANSIISRNSNRYDKNLFSDNKGGSKPGYYAAESSYDEVMFVLNKIKELKLNEGYQYKDFAILYRANAISRGFEDVFIRSHIPYVIYGGLSFFSRKEVKDILAYIRLVLNNDDNFSFKRIVNEPKRKIGPAILNRLTDESLKNKVSLFKAIDLIDRGGQGYANLIEFKFKILELYDDFMNKDIKLEDIIDVILDKTGYKAMLKADGPEGEDRLNNVLELKSAIREADEFFEGSRSEKLDAWLSDIALKTDVDKKNESDDVVKFMSFHQAKGLEYKVVFMVAMEQGIFPSSQSFTAEELDEERRICYVGVTRAKEKLFLSSASSRRIYGRDMFSSVSEYIKAMGDTIEDIKKSSVTRTLKSISKNEDTLKPSIERSSSTNYKVGDKLNHKLFGDGVVVSVAGDIITVAFSEAYGIKKLVASHPSIRRL